tara:strand:- start:68603 stop:68938 length:336 start_codon:yes stop_codon:yes gene_type:complete
MHVEVRSRNRDQVELRSWATQLASDTLRRFDTHVRKVDVRIQDINGPRGGIDKDVSIAMHMTGGGTKHIRHRASSYEEAVGMALRRAKQTLQRCQSVGARRHGSRESAYRH